MKKILCCLLAVMLCLLCSIPAFAANKKTTASQKEKTKPAADATTTTTTTTTSRRVIPADEETAQTVFEWFEKFIVSESESKSDESFEALLKMYEALKIKNVTDSSTLSLQLRRIAEDLDSEILPVFQDLTPIRAVFNRIMVDGNFDMKKAQLDIERSGSFASIMALYTGAYIVKTTSNPGNGMVENPKTGDDCTKTVAAVAILVAGVGTIFALSKKKDND